ncbi:DNA-binding response regulator, NarL/FixJ family, contains REC and HTH domains [Evansella caseinilytica]|uniref:DNA-binding response regulator, NarL/FixJ family, contains REC and HTH domains n=1 Tax=Evansella caseinilytica TaxID=1503961 RepID=A0A1H3QBQ1_9BACI|nr:response regulator transcription factor [Evansella caseinilytica]SDZ10518.1 DNA-binding response regulator, NarL/FixJ family, contains REC and HTH domains [Evansella caseinilytica]
MNHPIRVMLVDDHTVVRSGLKSLLSVHDHIKVVAEASSGREAVAKASSIEMDLILMDIRMQEGSGITACKTITEKYPHIKVIMLTSYDEDDIIYDSIVAGASGYLLKEIDTIELIQSIEKVAKGESLLDPAATLKVMNRLRRGETMKETEKLTPQEKQVLSFIANGKTNREIGKAMHLSEKTIRNYVSNIFSKLDLHNRAEAAAYAVRNKLDE